MSDATRRWLIAYDISDDRRRSRVARLLQAHGARAQFSVFLLDARPAKLQRLEDRLAERIDAMEDSILVCDLGSAAGMTTSYRYLGNSIEVLPSGPLVV